MKGIHLDVCTHHISIDNSRPITQPPRKINPTLKDIVKEKIENY